MNIKQYFNREMSLLFLQYRPLFYALRHLGSCSILYMQYIKFMETIIHGNSADFLLEKR